MTMAKNVSDHDLLLQLNVRFTDFVVRYDKDIKALIDGIGMQIGENKAKVLALEKEIDDLKTERIKQRNIFDGARLATGAIAGTVLYLLTQIPVLIRNWGQIFDK